MWGIDRIHQAAYDPEARLRVMDESGVHAQVLFPNSIGLGGQGLADSVADPVLRRLCVEIYNDAMAELQEGSGNRFLPDAGPAGLGRRRLRPGGPAGGRAGPPGREHDLRPTGPGRPRPRQPGLGPAVGGLRRAAAAGALPHRGQPHGDELLRQLLLAVPGRVHQAGDRRHDAVHQQRPGGGQHDPVPACSTATRTSRWCRSRAASAGSRSSSRPSTTRCSRTRRSSCKGLQRMPSEYFADHWYATFWFEQAQGDLQALVDKVGDRNILFETDFPHPTCLYPEPLATVGGEDGDAAAREPTADPRRERGGALPALTSVPGSGQAPAVGLGPAPTGHRRTSATSSGTSLERASASTRRGTRSRGSARATT